METLEKTLQVTHDWAVDRLHILCDMKTDDVLRSVEDAHAIQSEFAEWLDPNNLRIMKSTHSNILETMIKSLFGIGVLASVVAIPSPEPEQIKAKLEPVEESVIVEERLGSVLIVLPMSKLF